MDFHKFITENPRRKLLLKQRARFFKQYSNLQFDIVRSPAQIDRWNRIVRSKSHDHNKKFLAPETSSVNPSLMIKLIQHLPRRLFPQDFFPRLTPEQKMMKKRFKNAIRRSRRKKQLPPLPPGTKGNTLDYYKDFHKIDLRDLNVRKKYHTKSLPNQAQRKQWYDYIRDMQQAIGPRVIEHVNVDHDNTFYEQIT
jgi:hypothetical protein